VANVLDGMKNTDEAEQADQSNAKWRLVSTRGKKESSVEATIIIEGLAVVV
jgi:hypothetical protein